MNYEWEIFINKKCCQNYENTVKSSNCLNFFCPVDWIGVFAGHFWPQSLMF